MILFHLLIQLYYPCFMHKNALEDVYCKEMELCLKILIHIKYFHKRAGTGRGTKIKSDEKGGATTKKVMSPGLSGGMGSEQFDQRINFSEI